VGKILVTGGCGYLGSHTLVDLLQKGYACVSVDNYLNSDPKVLAQIEKITGQKVKNYAVDLTDIDSLDAIFDQEEIDAVIHFAALKAVGESVEKPLLYYRNNIGGTINLLECCKKYDTKHFIFSSSCTVYGQSEELPVTEETPEQRAESPYGYSKQVCERIIADATMNMSMNSALLRYFNPAGAHESIEIGESPINPPLNLVPIITEVGIGQREQLKVFGEDYNTRDGSCVRDYIHVMDLADAHTLALKYLETENLAPGETEAFNLGTGNGTTVLEAIQAFETASGQKLPYSVSERRPGDIEAIYANHDKAKTILGWKPKRDIVEIMKSAWAWEQKRSEN